MKRSLSVDHVDEHNCHTLVPTDFQCTSTELDEPALKKPKSDQIIFQQSENLNGIALIKEEYVFLNF